ncbi:Ff.00g026680.m01.CDS01 [Fusarium sp. VM40]|nr:Ff.00g026680.m01.CDS01 [Fusarium sp. VM40]
MEEQEKLIDLSPPLGHSKSEHPSFYAVSSPGAHSSETSNSSDTVIRTPHRRSFANLSPAALELFENDINFPSPDEFRLGRDLLADPTPDPLAGDAQAQTALLVTKDPQAVQEIQASSAASRDRTDQKPSHEPFLDKNLMEETEPGGTTVTRISTNNRSLLDPLMITGPSTVNPSASQTTGKSDLATPREIHYPPDHIGTNRGKFPRKRVPAYPRLEIPPSPDKTRIEPASDGKLRDTYALGGTGTEQLRPVTNSSTSTAAPSWGQSRLSASERDRAVSDSIYPHRSPVSHGRNDNQTGIAKPVQNNPRDSSQQRDSGREIPGKRSATPASARDPSSRQQPELATERETRQHEQGRSQGGMCIHKHHHHYWLRSDNIIIPFEKTLGKSRGYSAQAQTQPGDPQPKKLWHNSKQLGSLPEESWTEYIAEIDVLERDSSDRYYVGKLPGASERTTTDGSIQRCRTIHRGASSTAPMQQFVNIHIHKGSRQGQDGGEKERNPTEGQGSFEQRSTSISYTSYRAPKPNNPSGDARARQSSNTSERRRRHRRSFQ